MPFLTPKIDFGCIPTPAPGAESLHMNFDEWQKVANILQVENLPQCNASIYTPGVSIKTTEETCTNGWTYNRTWFPETLTTQFNLVCNEDWLITLQQSIFMLGILFGVFISGVISDRFGRKLTIIGLTCGVFAFGIAASYAHTFILFIIFRFMIAFCKTSVFTTTYVYCLEMIGGKWSTFIGIGLEFPWALGYSVLPLIAYHVRDWSWLQFVITIPLVFFLLVTFFLPESPRWLLARGKLDDAKEVLSDAMKINGKGEFPKDFQLTQVRLMM